MCACVCVQTSKLYVDGYYTKLPACHLEVKPSMTGQRRLYGINIITVKPLLFSARLKVFFSFFLLLFIFFSS